MKSTSFILFAALLFAGGTPTANAQTELTPKCETPTSYLAPSCWLGLFNHDQCYIFIEDVYDEMMFTWSGRCQSGVPDGYGILSRHLTDIKFHDEPARAYTDEYTGAYQDGKRHGEWREKEIFFDNTQLVDQISAGGYVDGKKHGEWKTEGHTTFSDSDLELRDSVITTYAHGKFHGPHKYSSTSFFPPENRYTSGAEGQHVDGKRHGRWSSQYYGIDGKKDALNTWCREYSNGEIVNEKEGEGC